MAYLTYREIPQAISFHENFNGNSAWAERNEKGWYYIYSYSTIMAIVLPSGDAVINTSYYSRTTSRLQHIIKHELGYYHDIIEHTIKAAEYGYDNDVMMTMARKLAS